MRQKFTLLFLCLFSLLIVNAQTKSTTNRSKVVPKKANTYKRVSAKRSVATIKKDSARVSTGVRVKITTDSGIIVIKLYDSTPIHRDNFVKLVRQGFFDSLLFHRVIPGFMIQGGDPTSKYAQEGQLLGSGGSDMERLTAEITPTYFHKRGALAAARDNNPEMKSSAVQFYIVDGKKFTDSELSFTEQRTGRKFTDAERNYYKTIGGAAMLDNQYTVFGETESGLEVIDKIANAPRDSNNRPLGNIRMKMEILP